MGQIILSLVCGIIIFLGLAGTLLPFLPGPQLSLVGLILYAWLSPIKTVSGFWLIIFSILTILTMLVDIFGPGLGARKTQATKLGVWGATLGGFFGVFIFGPIGILAGPFIGGFLGEYTGSKNHIQALRSAWGAFVAMMVGAVFKFIVSLSMTIYFIFAIIKSL
ncbi:MAG TPA: DUF456 domain-containing protein [Methylomirabilota bacterium]|nr:DUF456 domain-containing protein [Methylomirabilota bacterium]